MLRTTGANSTTLSPGSRTGFQDENPPSVPAGTQLTAAWHNDMQESLAAILEGTGVTLSDSGSVGGDDQVLNSIRMLAGSNYTLVTTTESLTLAMVGHIDVNCSGGNVTLTLPLAASLNGSVASTETIENSVRYTINRIDSSANTLTIQTSGSDSFNFAGLSGSSFQVAPLAVADIYSNANATWEMIVLSISPGPPAWEEWTSHGTSTFTVPAGKISIRATLNPGGGGGGGTKQSGDAGVSGAGGDECVFNIAVTPGEVLTINVGQGGTAGAGSGSSPTAGGGGGTTSIYSGATMVCEVSGGAGGAASAGAGIATTGVGTGTGTPTAGTGATLVSTKGATGSGAAISIGSGLLNAQGGSVQGVGLAAVVSTTPAQPSRPGNGGWGGIYASSTPGGGSAGGDGYVRLEW